MTVVITGGGRGLGRAAALAFAARGRPVVVNFLRDEAAAEATVKAILSRGGRAEARRADVADPLQARDLVDFAARRWEGLGGIVNNAGIARDRLILKMSDQDWRSVLDVNLSGAFYCLRAAAAVLARQREGFILNIGSLLGRRGGVGCANYAAAKAGLEGLTRAAARELGRFNIRVNAVFPGYHPTSLGSASQAGRVEEIRRDHALGRFTDTGDLGSFLVFLAEQKSASGQIYNFDSRVM
jgi:3-oxoacyl-[acyl-carrier protein] reductase